MGPHRRNRPLTALVAIVLALGVVLTACSSGSDQSRRASEADGSTTTVVGPTTTSAADPTTTIAPDGSPTTSSTVASSTTSSTVATSTTSTTAPTTTTTTLPLAPTSALLPCASSVTIGPLEVQAVAADTCLARNGLEWVTNRQVTVGGIDFRPTSDTSLLRFDPLNARVAAVGYRAMGVVLGAPLEIASGVIDWSFQYTPSQNGPVGFAMPVVTDTVNLATVGRLPGLADVHSYPKQPVTGFADYTVVTDESVTQLAGKFPSLATKDVVFPLDAIGLREIPAYTISIPSALVQKIAGLNVSGALTMQPVSRSGAIGVSVKMQLDLPEWLSGFKGRFGAFFPTGGSTRIDELLVDIREVDLGVVRFEGVYLNYDAATKTWAGRTTVMLGIGDDAVGLGAVIAIIDGRLQSVGVTVTGLPINIGAGASINSLGGTLTLEPLGIRAMGQLGLGPYVPNAGNIAVIDGTLVTDTTELTMAGSMTIGKVVVGGLELKGLQVGDARISYYWSGQFNIDGNAKFYLDSAETWGLRGGLHGGATADMISLGGDVRIDLGPFLSLGGTAAVSSRGWIGCGIMRGLWFRDVRIGVSYDWGDEVAKLRGNDCNSDEYMVPMTPATPQTTTSIGRGASSADATGEKVDVRSGERMVTFTLQGRGAAATIIGPDGTTITVTGREQSAESDPVDPRWMVVHQPNDSVTYVYVAQPAAGTWTVAHTGAIAPVVTAAVVSGSSQPKDAVAEPLHPTSGRTQPILAAVSVDRSSPSTASNADAWARAAVVLLGLVLVLVLLDAAARRRA